MAKQLFTNNAGSMLAVTIDDNDLSVQVGAGHGALFPNPTGGDWFLVTLVNSSGDLEICKCTARSTDVLTVVRAQEGTTPQAWTANQTRVELRNTADTMERFTQRTGDVFTAADGTISAPGFSWENAASSGWYRAAAGDFRFSISGADVVTVVSPLWKSAYQIRCSNNGAALQLEELDGPADEKTWSFQCEAGDLLLRARNDAFGGGSIPLTIRRTATVIDEIDLAATLITLDGGAHLTGALNLGHATDTTIARASAGQVTIEGNQVYHAGNTTIASGTYSPTITAGLNMASASLSGLAQYTRIGNIVQVTMRVVADPTATGLCAFTASLPIASNFTVATDAHGIVAGVTTGVGEVGADFTADTLSAFWTALSAISDEVRIVATYRVL